MDLKIRGDLKEIEEDMIKDFCDRKASMLIQKSPEEIINMWLDWQYARFKVKEDVENNIYILYDFEKLEPVMIINRSLPGSYQCIHGFCDTLNDKKSEELMDHEKEINFKDFLDLNILEDDEE